MSIHGWGNRVPTYRNGPMFSPVTPGGTGFQPTEASIVRNAFPNGRPPRTDRFMQADGGGVWLVRKGTRWLVPNVETLHALRAEHNALGMGFIPIERVKHADIARNRQVTEPPPRS